ncbi:MAG: hypothetical protein Q9221_002565 [Calogaya cf. arnoldii]
MDPLIFLSALSKWLKEEQPRLDFDYYRAHNICWRLLRRIEASPKIQKKFREKYPPSDLDIDNENDLKYIPSFIFSRHLEEPKGQWMQSVGGTVTKFFREQPAETLSPISTPETDDPTDIRYAEGYRMSDDIYHPEKNGKCYHVGVCELQVAHWRIQAGLGPWEEGDADGAWWLGLRAEAATAPLTITAEEIIAVIPPEGRSIVEVLIHFRGRLHTAQMKEFCSLLKSVSNYHHDTRWLTPLLTEKTADGIANHGRIAAPAPIPPLTITAEEIRALIPAEGISLLEVVTHSGDALARLR